MLKNITYLATIFITIISLTVLAGNSGGKKNSVDKNSEPVSSLKVDLQDGAVCVVWNTIEENDLKGFEVQRKRKNGSFQTVIFIPGAGNTVEAKRYTYFDRDATDGDYDYRIKRIDFTGEELLSDVVSVSLTSPDRLSLTKRQASQFNPSTDIEFTLPKSSKVDLAVYNSMGEKIKTILFTNYEPGVYDAKWDGKDVNGAVVDSGVYLIRLKTEEEDVTQKLVVLK